MRPATLGAWARAAVGATIDPSNAAAPGGEPQTETEGLMHDLMHAAIAAERTRDLVEIGDRRRAIRRSRRTRAAATAPARRQPTVDAHGSRTAALLRLRPWVM